MSQADRLERFETIKALGRVAYRNLKDTEIVGIITFVGGEEKRLRRALAAEICASKSTIGLTISFRLARRFAGVQFGLRK